MYIDEENYDNLGILYEQIDELRHYIVKKNLPGAKKAVTYLEDFDAPIFQLDVKLDAPNIYEILEDYNLDPAVQKFILLYQACFQIKLKCIISNLDCAFDALNLKLSDVSLKEEPAYMERARQMLEKFAQDDERHDALIKRSKKRIARIRAKKEE